MRTLAKPELDPRTVYLTCISRVKARILKTELESVVDIIEEDAKRYENLSGSAEWYLFEESDSVNDIVSLAEMEKVYTNRMAKKKAPGREVYDEIKESSPFNICPLCGHRPVEQLDHYLPKTKFPSVVVLPVNLVPSCEKCNKIKLGDVPNGPDNQTLHPYYDDVTAYQWLFAEIRETSPASFKFCVRIVAEFDDEINKRIKYHFDKLELGLLYASQSGAFVSDISHRLTDLHAKAGMDEVRDYLMEEERSRRKVHVNSWQRAMFQALANSDWFCDGGFSA